MLDKNNFTTNMKEVILDNAKVSRNESLKKDVEVYANVLADMICICNNYITERQTLLGTEKIEDIKIWNPIVPFITPLKVSFASSNRIFKDYDAASWLNDEKVVPESEIEDVLNKYHKVEIRLANIFRNELTTTSLANIKTRVDVLSEIKKLAMLKDDKYVIFDYDDKPIIPYRVVKEDTDEDAFESDYFYDSYAPYSSADEVVKKWFSTLVV